MYRKYKRAQGGSHSDNRRPAEQLVISSGNPALKKPERKGSNLASPDLPRRRLSPANRSPSPAIPRDVMISYSHNDSAVMVKLRDTLEANGIRVWSDTTGLCPGVNFLSSIGQAIIEAKMFISMVSRSSIKSKFCQDELALAYVSGKPIFPIALEKRKTLFPLMGSDARLQLAGYEWSLFLEPSEFDKNFEHLLKLLRDELKSIKDAGEKENTKSKGYGTRPTSSRRKINPKLSLSIPGDVPENNPRLQQNPQEFWKESFAGLDQVDWNRFWNEVRSIFTQELEDLYGSDRITWLENILSRELDVNDNILKRENFLEFCLEEDNCPFWIRMEEQAKESVAMEAVFNMDSSVRVEAIENLAKFKSPAVVDALQDLLRDERADVRAVAAICMARIGDDQEITVRLLRRSLQDRDRLVREAGCIAIGKLKIQSALKELLNIWRNDVIADVRASAELALKQIGGPEVEKEMKVTKVLSEEIRMLTKRV